MVFRKDQVSDTIQLESRYKGYRIDEVTRVVSTHSLWMNAFVVRQNKNRSIRHKAEDGQSNLE